LGRLKLGVISGLLISLCYFGPNWPGVHLDPFTMIVTSLFVFVEVIVLVRFVRSSLRPLPDGWILGEKTITLTDEGIRSQGAHVDTFIHWPAVIDILETPALLLVMIDLPSGLIIPKRCFGSEIECHEFVEALRQHSRAVSLGS